MVKLGTRVILGAGIDELILLYVGYTSKTAVAVPKIGRAAVSVSQTQDITNVTPSAISNCSCHNGIPIRTDVYYLYSISSTKMV